MTASLRTSSESVFPSIITFYLARRNSPLQARTSAISRLHDHTQTHHTRQYSSGRVISPTHRLLPDDTQHSQERDIHASGGIRTHNPSKRAASDLRHKLRCHWDGLHSNRTSFNFAADTTLCNNQYELPHPCFCCPFIRTNDTRVLQAVTDYVKERPVSLLKVTRLETGHCRDGDWR